VAKYRRDVASLSRPSRGVVVPRLGLASVEISNASVSSDLWQDINDAILLYFPQKSPFWGYKCVIIQNSTWILLRSAAAYQHVGAHSADSVNQRAAAERKSIQVEFSTVTHL